MVFSPSTRSTSRCVFGKKSQISPFHVCLDCHLKYSSPRPFSCSFFPCHISLGGSPICLGVKRSMFLKSVWRREATKGGRMFPAACVAPVSSIVVEAGPRVSTSAWYQTQPLPLSELGQFPYPNWFPCGLKGQPGLGRRVDD